MITYDQKQDLYGVPSAPKRRAQRFESLNQWVDANDNKKHPHERFENASKKAAMDSWDYGSGYHGALELVRDGWQDGAEKVLQTATDAKITGDDLEAIALHQAPHGVFGDVQAALNGDLEPFYNVDLTPQKTPVLTLVAAISAQASVKAEDFTRRGAGILTAVQMIERSGIRVELYALVHGEDHTTPKSSVTTVTKVKHPDQDLYLEGLAAVFAHPAPFRRIGFSDIERLAPKSFHAGYGSATEHPAPEVISHLFNGDKPVLCPPLYSPNDMRDVREVARRICAAVYESGKVTDEVYRDWINALA